MLEQLLSSLSLSFFLEREFRPSFRRSLRRSRYTSMKRAPGGKSSISKSIDGEGAAMKDTQHAPGEVERIVGTPDYLAPELLLGTGHGMRLHICKIRNLKCFPSVYVFVLKALSSIFCMGRVYL